MTTIGTLTSTEGGLTGSIRALSFNPRLVSAVWRTRPTSAADMIRTLHIFVDTETAIDVSEGTMHWATPTS